jgi:hypothetical protein
MTHAPKKLTLAVAGFTTTGEAGLSLALFPTLSLEGYDPHPTPSGGAIHEWHGEATVTQQRATSTTLFTLLKQMSEATGYPPQAITHVVWEHGPGSFTALRAVATWLATWQQCQASLSITCLTQAHTVVGHALASGATTHHSLATHAVGVMLPQPRGAVVWQVVGKEALTTPLQQTANLNNFNTDVLPRYPYCQWLTLAPPHYGAVAVWQAAQTWQEAGLPLPLATTVAPAYASQPQLTATVSYAQG